MEELLQQYSVSDILIFIVILALAIKELSSYIDWAKGKRNQCFTEEIGKRDKLEQFENLVKRQNQTDNDIKEIKQSLQMLIQSDRDDIKAWITEKHHYFCYEKKYIDDYTLDCIEKRYAHYTNEGGNSFVEDLMIDLRELKKVSGLKEREENKKS